MMPTAFKPAATNHLLILASQSPRRIELCGQAGITVDRICPADIDETALASERPSDYARRMAEGKARAISEQYPSAFILGADTVVACGRRILPKAEDITTAEACLSVLSGRRHKVYGGVCVIMPDGRIKLRVSVSTVQFKQLTAAEISAYLNSGEWDGKAGGYAIQGQASLFIQQISGSYSNIVGLDLNLVYGMLNSAGFSFAAAQ